VPAAEQDLEPAVTAPRPRRRWLRRTLLGLLAVVLLGVAAIAAPVVWMTAASAGHLHDTVADAPSAPVVIVFGAELAPGGQRPKPFLAGRLDIAAELVRAGKARAVLVSGDAGGRSGDEVTVMTRYLVDRGVEQRRIVADPHGLDSYDTCARARQVYGIRRALLVSQAFHLPRAVTLCRRLGVDADGVSARCDGCRAVTLRKNRVREVGADAKAVGDALRDRPPAVQSPQDSAVTEALRG
jgi:vancomycin permeability regulator SanA